MWDTRKKRAKCDFLGFWLENEANVYQDGE